MSVLWLLLLLVFVGIGALHVLVERHLSRIRKVGTGERVPGTRGIFLVWELLRNELNRSNKNPIIAAIEQNDKRYGDAWGSLLFNMRALWLADPESAKVVLRNEEDFTRLRPKSTFFDRFSIASLSDVSGKEWEKQRHLMSGAFHYEELQGMFPTFVDKATKVVDIVRDTTSKEGIQVVELMNRATLDVIGAVAFGSDFNALSEYGGHKHAIKISYEALMKEFGNGMRFFEWYNKRRSEHNLKMEKHIDDFNQYIADIVTRKRAGVVNESKKGNDVMDCMLRANDGGTLSDRELMDNAKLFYIAGHETSSSALSFAIGCLAEHPELQERLYNEVYETIGDGAPTVEKIKEMSFLQNCIKEVLRLYSPAVAMFRVTTKDLILHDYEVPKGTFIFISLRSMHLSEEFWEEPLKFNPDRFLKKVAHPFAYLPFGAGPRVCLGQNLAMLEMRVILAQLVQSFVFKPIAGHQLINDAHFIFRPPLTYRVEFVPRN